MELPWNKTNTTHTSSIRNTKDLMDWKQRWIAHICHSISNVSYGPVQCHEERLQFRREKWQRRQWKYWPFVPDNSPWSRVALLWGDFPRKHSTFSLQPELESTDHAGLKSIHPGCSLHSLLKVLFALLHKGWIPLTWFWKKMWMAKNA